MSKEETTVEQIKKLGGLLDKLKAKFNIEEVKLSEYKTADGATVKIEGDLAAGSRVTMVTAEGETPATGDIVLESGETLKCKDGVIEEVVPKAQEEMMSSEVVKKLEDRIAALEAANTAQKTELSKANESLKEMAEANTQMFSVIEQLAGEPEEEPAQKKKQGFTRTKDTSLRNRVLAATK